MMSEKAAKIAGRTARHLNMPWSDEHVAATRLFRLWPLPRYWRVHLRDEPTRVSKRRIMRLRDLSQPQYRLRVGEVRVLYDVTREAVEVLAIVTKANMISTLYQVKASNMPFDPPIALPRLRLGQAPAG